MKIITRLLILSFGSTMDPEICTVTTYLSRYFTCSKPRIFERFANIVTFFSFPYPLFLLFYQRPRPLLLQRREIQLKSVTIISHVRDSGSIRQIDEWFCVSGEEIFHFF